MKRAWGLAAISLSALAVSALPSAANTVVGYGSLTPNPTISEAYASPGNITGQFWTDFNFTLTTTSTIDVSSAQYTQTDPSNNISPFSIGLYSGTAASVAGQPAGDTTPVNNSVFPGQPLYQSVTTLNSFIGIVQASFIGTIGPGTE